jgi:ribulose-5-phosphate 4-epimerase/fuculose-1-phosphate aldolase
VSAGEGANVEGIAPILEELITANRILATERVLDSFGHVSVRHPQKPDRFLLSRARAPELIAIEDIMEFTLDGRSVGQEPGKPYSERFIHGALYEARPDVGSVVHNHSPSVIPFSVTGRKMRPIMHMCAPIGNDIPNWDIRDKFGDKTNLLVTNIEMGRDFARCLGHRTVALMRGHGSTVVGRSLREVVFTSVYMEINADLLIKSLLMGDIVYLSDGEIETITKARAGFTFERAWENWCNRVGRPYVSGEWSTGEGYSRSEG